MVEKVDWWEIYWWQKAVRLGDENQRLRAALKTLIQHVEDDTAHISTPDGSDPILEAKKALNNDS